MLRILKTAELDTRGGAWWEWEGYLLPLGFDEKKGVQVFSLVGEWQRPGPE